MEQIKKIFFKKENLYKLLESKIPVEAFEDKYHKYIEDFNVCDITTFFNKHEELLNYNTDFYTSVLLKTRSIISDVYNEFNHIDNDFSYFVKKVIEDYDYLVDQLNCEYDLCVNQHKDNLESNCLDEISCGIFSSTEAYSRKVYFDILGPKHSDEYNSVERKLRFCVDNFYSYLYIKTEQILFFFYNIYNAKKDEKVYLMNKYLFLINQKTFDATKFKQIEIESLNKIWKYYKHQEIIEQKIVDNLYMKKFIQENINIVNKFYNYLSDFKNMLNLIDKIDEYILEIDGILNPLGLTGFEND